ncbi:MAG: DHH family phosphoesterase [Candidatus Thermoplasmatota archaeon]|nr:DHH family phosphoesterase [Candidatus Thermoplasmatota archaeon]
MTDLELHPVLQERLNDAKSALLNCNGEIVRVVSHYDSDGISSASVLTLMLSRMGLPFHATMSRSLDRHVIEKLRKEQRNIFIFSDMGSGQLDMLRELNSTIIVLDHHKGTGDVHDGGKVIHVNPSLFGSNGTTEVSGSTTCFLLAQHVDSRNWDSSPLALTGAYGDMQHLGGFKGLNEAILQKAIQRKVLYGRKMLSLQGFNLLESLKLSPEPYFTGLTGREENIIKYFGMFGIDTTKPYASYDADDVRKVSSILMTVLASNGVDFENVSQIIATHYFLPGREISISELSSLANSCGRTENYSTGLALELGDISALNEGRKLRNEYNSRIIERMIPLEGGIEQLNSIQYFGSDDASLSGALCGLYMSFVGKKDKPTIVYSQSGSELKISARGTRKLVSEGLDLAASLSKSATECGGQGGGHVIASGASVPVGKLDIFLKIVDEITSKQLKRNVSAT